MIGGPIGKAIGGASPGVTSGPLRADAGAYGLTGRDVRLAAARAPLLANTGLYVLAGQDVALIVSLSPAGFGRILMVGTTATKIFGFAMIQNFAMVAGDSKSLVVSVHSADGSPVNIANSTIKWHATRSLGKAAALEKSTADGIAITSGAGGIFTVTLDAEDTESLVGGFLHEAEVTFPDGTRSTVLQGTMKVNPRLIANV